MNTFKHAHMVLGLILAFSALILLSFCMVQDKTVAEMKQAVVQFIIGKQVSLQTADFQEIRTDNFIIKFTPSDKECVNMIGKAAEKSYASVCQFMGEKPAHKTMLIIYPDNLSMNQSFGWDRDEKAMGVYWAGTIRILSPGEWITGGDIAEQYSNEGPMVHEFTHLMVDDMTSGNYNRWWTEGIAQYVEKKLTGFQFSDPFAGKKKVFYYDLAVLGKDFDCLNQQVAYWESLQAVEFIVNHYGEDKIYSILEYLGKGYSLQRAIMVSLNIEYQDFCQDFYVELEKQ